MIYQLIYYIRLFLNDCSLLKTIYVNFKAFPFEIAIKLPILVYKRCELVGIYKGCFSLQENVNPQRFMLHIGQNKFPIFSCKGKFTRVSFQEQGQFKFGVKTTIKAGVSINIYKKALLDIGSGTTINQDSLLFCKNKITLGENCSVGWKCQIYDTNFHHLYNKKNHSISRIKGEVVLENNVWLANHVTVTKNAFIPAYSIIGAHSLVNKKLVSENEGTIFVGIPVVPKSSGFYRILNRKLEINLDQWYIENPEGDYPLSGDFEVENYLSRF